MQKAGVQIEQIRTEIGQMEEVIARSDSRIAVLHNDISHNERSVQTLAEEQKSVLDSQESFARYIAQKEAEKTVLLEKQEQADTKIKELNRENEQYQEQLLRMNEQLTAQKGRRSPTGICAVGTKDVVGNTPKCLDGRQRTDCPAGRGNRRKRRKMPRRWQKNKKNARRFYKR